MQLQRPCSQLYQRSLIMIDLFLLVACPAQIHSQILHGHLDHISSNTNVSWIPAHTVHPGRCSSNTNWAWHQQRQRRRKHGCQWGTNNRSSLATSSDTLLVHYQETSFAIHCKVLTVVLKHVIIAKSILKKIHSAVDDRFRGVRCCSGACATTYLG